MLGQLYGPLGSGIENQGGNYLFGVSLAIALPNSVCDIPNSQAGASNTMGGKSPPQKYSEGQHAKSEGPRKGVGARKNKAGIVFDSR